MTKKRRSPGTRSTEASESVGVDETQSTTSTARPRLSTKHREFLTANAIDAERMACAETAEDGIRFRLKGLDGRELLQYRPDQPKPGEPKYSTQRGERLVFPVPPGGSDLVNDLGKTIVFVEGTKGHLAAASCSRGEFAVVGLMGVRGWGPGTETSGVVNPDIHDIPLAGRRVAIMVDADRTHNRDVWNAANEFRDHLLTTCGASEVWFADVPGGGSSGIDDLLAGIPDEGDRRAEVLARVVAKHCPKGTAPRVKRTGTGYQFFVDTRLLVARASKALLDADYMAVGRDGSILVWDADLGYSRSDGVDRFKSLVIALLGDWYEPRHLANLLEVTAESLRLSGRSIQDFQPGLRIPFVGGILDVETMELGPPDPDFLSTRCIQVRWDPKAKSTFYRKWLKHRTAHWRELEDALSTMLDNTGTPQRSVMMFGGSRSGKGTVIRLAEALVGKSDASSIPLQSLGERFQSHEIYGKTLNICGDLSSDAVKDLSLFKQMTGQDLVQGEPKYKSHFTFTNAALFVFAANTIPRVQETSGAYFARMIPVEFPNTFVGAEDETIEQALQAELPGIAVRLVRALRRRKRRGGYLPVPEDVAEKFRVGSDTTAQFVAENYSKVEGGFISRPEVWTDFKTWSEDSRVGKALGRTNFYKKLESGGVRLVSHPKTRVRGWELKRLGGDVGPPEDSGLNGGVKESRDPPHENRGVTGKGAESSLLATDPDTDRSGAGSQVGGSPSAETGGVNGKKGGSPSGVSGVLPLLLWRLDKEIERGIYTEESSDQLCSIRSDPRDPPVSAVLAVDFESGSAAAFRTADTRAYIKCLGWSWRDNGGEIRSGSTSDYDAMRRILSRAESLVWFNGVGFDVPVAARHLGLDLASKSFDVDGLYRAANPKRAPGESQGLGEAARRLLGSEKHSDVLTDLAVAAGSDGRPNYDGIDPADPLLHEYCRNDVELTLRLYESLVGEFEGTGYVAIQRVVSQVGYRVGVNGFKVDVELAEQLSASTVELRAELAETFRADLGVDTAAANPWASKAARVAFASRAEKVGAKYHRTPKGGVSLKRELLSEVDTLGDAWLGRFVELTLEGSAVALNYPKQVLGELVGDRVYPGFNDTSDNGRWASKTPNILGAGKRTPQLLAARGMFVVDAPGLVLVGADLSGIDNRAVAGLSGDATYLELLQPGADIHQETANRLGIPRAAAKTVNHGINYGLQAASLAQRLKATQPEAQTILDGYARQFPTLESWKGRIRDTAARGDLLDNGFGRRIAAAPGGEFTSSVARVGAACARDLLVHSLQRDPELVGKVWLIVHDEVILQVPEVEADEYRARLLAAMTWRWESPSGSIVPILAEVYEPAATSWAGLYPGAES